MKIEVENKVESNCINDCKGENTCCLKNSKKINGSDLLECLHESPNICEYSLPYGNIYFCRCPIGRN